MTAGDPTTSCGTGAVVSLVEGDSTKPLQPPVAPNGVGDRQGRSTEGNQH
jgi:hypothetical protein